MRDALIRSAIVSLVVTACAVDAGAPAEPAMLDSARGDRVVQGGEEIPAVCDEGRYVMDWRLPVVFLDDTADDLTTDHFVVASFQTNQDDDDQPREYTVSIIADCPGGVPTEAVCGDHGFARYREHDRSDDRGQIAECTVTARATGGIDVRIGRIDCGGITGLDDSAEIVVIASIEDSSECIEGATFSVHTGDAESAF